MGGGKLRVGWGVEQGGPGRHGRVGGVTLSARAHAKLGPHCCWHHMVGWPFLLVQDMTQACRSAWNCPRTGAFAFGRVHWDLGG